MRAEKPAQMDADNFMGRRSKGLVGFNHLPGILLASEAECERWIEADLIPVEARRSVRKGERTVGVRQFDPDVIAALAPKVPSWRRHDQAEIHAHRSEAATKAHSRKAAGAQQHALGRVDGLARATSLA